jgi:uncharacterized membrane protein SirB2
MSRARLPLWGHLILWPLTLWAVVVIAPDFLRVFDQDFNNKLPFEADNNGLLSRNESTRVADCESIDLKRNYCEGRLPDLLAVFGGMGGMQYVRPELKNVSLYFVCGNSLVESLSTTPVSIPLATPIKWLCDNGVDTAAATSQLLTVDTSKVPLSLFARFTLFLAQMLGLAFIGIAVLLVLYRPSVTTWGFFLYAIWFNPGQYYVFYAWLERWPSWVLLTQEAAQAFFQAVGYCGFVLFALRFPRNVAEPRWRSLERVLPCVLATLLILQLSAFMAVFGFRSEWAARLNFCAGVVITGVVLAILFIRYRDQDQQDRHRIRYVFWGSIFGLAAFNVAELDTATTLLDVRLPEGFIYVLYSFNATVAIAVWHAVSRYRVVDVKFTLSRSGIKYLLWMVFAILLISADSFQTKATHYFDTADLLTKILILVLVFVALMLVKSIIDWLQGQSEILFDNLFFGKMRQAEMDLAKLSDKLAHTDGSIPPESVDKEIVATPTAALELASAAVFRRRQDGRFSRTRAEHWPDDAIKILTAEHDLIKQLQGPKAAGILLEPNQLPRDVPQGLALPALAVPIIYSGRLEAVALYGAHCEGDDLNEDEIQMLNKLANAASSAYMTFELELLRRRTEFPGVPTLITSSQP